MRASVTRGSLRRRARIGFAVTAGLLVVAAVLAAVGLVGAGHDRTRLLDRVDPAIQHADDYETSLVDQSSGARLYAELGETSALHTYEMAITTATTAAVALRVASSHLSGLVGPLGRTEQLVGAWQRRYLHPLVARPGPSAAGNSILLRTGSSVAFAGIRQHIAAIVARLERIRSGAVRGFNDAINLLVGLVIAVFIGIAVLLVLVWLWVRSSVLTPLAAVGADSRTVTAGEFDHVVSPQGPVEIARLAEDIEAMRSRVVEDLHALETAHRAVAAQRLSLEERTVELGRSNRDLEQFAYVASHDLQEPLRKVAAFCQLLSERYEDKLDDKGQQYIAFAVDGAKRMQALVNDLLAFSRVGRTHDRWTDVDLSVSLRRALTNIDSRVVESGAAITVSDPLPTVRGDASLLAALFQNLIGNAIKFASDVPPVIEVSCERDGEAWSLRVSDNGIGIEPRFAERVFVIFQRLHARDEYEGTGIGLALCRRIVEFHGGRIIIEEQDAPGTTISFTLPIESPEHESTNA